MIHETITEYNNEDYDYDYVSLTCMCEVYATLDSVNDLTGEVPELKRMSLEVISKITKRIYDMYCDED